jgi:hypothetical protein
MRPEEYFLMMKSRKKLIYAALINLLTLTLKQAQSRFY